MFQVTVQTNFWASHRLTLSDGTKEAVHSHNWKVTAKVSGEKLDRMGLLIDFKKLKKMIENIIAPLANQLLENNRYFHQNNSSAEIIAEYIFENLQPQLPKHLTLKSISITEEPGCSGKFFKNS